MSTRTRRRGRNETTRTIRLGTENYVLLAAGLAALTLGYILLARGSTIAAPLLLVLGYVVLLPLAIIR